MIELGRFETCVCQRRGFPDSLCDSNLSFEEKGKKVKLTPRKGGEAKALVIDPCVCKDTKQKCDGLFLYRHGNNHWMILIELKGKEIDHAFEQLAYMRKQRSEYIEIENLFTTGQVGKVQHEAFIVSNFRISRVDQQKLEQANNIRVKKVLHSEATKSVPDIRDYL